MRYLTIALIFLSSTSFINLNLDKMPNYIQGSDAAPIWYCAYEVASKTVEFYKKSDSGVQILDITGDVKVPGSVTPETPNGINAYGCVIDSVSKEHMIGTLTELGVTDPNGKLEDPL